MTLNARSPESVSETASDPTATGQTVTGQTVTGQTASGQATNRHSDIASGIASDIAIIGMSVLLPGAKGLKQYWHNILGKADCVQSAPDGWAEPYFDPAQALTGLDSARIYTRKVGLLGDLADFNPLEFGIPPKAIEGDPAHFLALAMAQAALKDAGYLDRPFNRESTGIVMGRGNNPNRGDATGLQYGLMIDQTLDLLQQLTPQPLSSETIDSLRQGLKESLPPMEIDQAPSLVSNVVTGRIANRLNLMGPNYLVDAACSSSLIAVSHAIDDLVSGRSDMMLAGGVQVSMSAQIYMLFCQLQALSRGDIRPFDEAASGTVLGEGVGFLALKRLSDAKRDGDRIYAVLKGVGISSDGKSKGLLAPRGEGQVLALERAYRQTGLDPQSISLIEAHGTGIPLGDRTEMQTLRQVFGDRRGHLPDCAIGSVKSMIGHCIPASGIASIVKMALSLYHKVLPPTLCDRPHPDLNLAQTPFYISNEIRPWVHPGDRLRRAGVNAFGFGGINTHAILEEVDQRPDPNGAVYQPPAEPYQAIRTAWPSELWVLAAESATALLIKLNQIQTFLNARPDAELADVAYTLAQEAAHTSLSHRLAIVIKNRADAERKLTKAATKLQKTTDRPWQIKGSIFYSPADITSAGKTAFLFSTEGSQYSQMLTDLCLYFPQVRAWFDFLDETFARADRPSQVIFSAPTGLNAEQQQWAESALFAADLATETVSTGSLAIYELLKAFQVPCDVMVGHSAGEHVAMRAAGMVAVKSRSHLKQLLQNLNQVYSELEREQAIPTGTLLSVGAVSGEAIEKLLGAFADKAYLVADNCDNQRLIFVDPSEQAAVINFVKQLDGICTPLPFDRAYHTPLFKRGTEALRAYYETVELGDGAIPVYSCASTEPYPKDPDAMRDLSAQQWSLPVRFRETIERLYADGVRTFVEVGAGNNLSNFVNSVLTQQECLVLPTNVPRRAGLMQLQAVIGRLWAEGTALDFSPFYSDRPLQMLDWQAQTIPAAPFALPLNMALPKLQISEAIASEFRTQVTQQIAQTAATQTAATQTLVPPTAIAQPQPTAANTAPLHPPASQPVSPASAPASASSSPQPAPTPPVSAPIFQMQQKILADHFAMMDNYLDMQANISAQLFQQLGDLRRPADPPAAPNTDPPATPDAAPPLDLPPLSQSPVT